MSETSQYSWVTVYFDVTQLCRTLETTESDFLCNPTVIVLGRLWLNNANAAGAMSKSGRILLIQNFTFITAEPNIGKCPN